MTPDLLESVYSLIQTSISEIYIARLVAHGSGIAEIIGLNPVSKLDFFVEDFFSQLL